jgi:hypothetical protein
MMLSLAPASAEVVWDHTLTDPSGDVISVLAPGTPVTGREEVDILSASARGEGDDMNVSLVLAGAHDADANYEVRVTVDGDGTKEYTFTLSYGVFSINGYDLVEDDPRSSVSADGRTISWLVEKARVTVTEGVEVTHAQAMLPSGITNYVDTAPDEGNNGGNGGNGGGSEGPINVRVETLFKRVDRVVQTIELVIEGEDAKDLRGEFDSDVDGTVTRTEYDQHIEFFHLEFASWNSTDIKLDGNSHESKVMTFELEGVVGSSTSTSPVTQVVVLDITFPQVDEGATHTYSGSLLGDRAGDMWDVTADSLWTVSAPSGWRFKAEELPEGVKTYLGGGGSTITMSGLQMRADWNGSVGAVNALVITEKAGGGDEDAPGFAAPMAAFALLAVLVASSRRRR